MSQAISKTTYRRYFLGRSGLWPGRRWQGKEGAAAAIHALGALQVDPLTVVARSHDLVLHSRVTDYRPEYLDELLYKDRRFFDYGGVLHVRPMEELPYWRVVMRRRAAEPRQQRTLAEHGETIAALRRELCERGPLGNRDLAGQSRVASYRARKDTGLALYYLWLTGELMSHHRTPGFERVYALNEQVAPPELDYEASAEDAEEFFAAKASRRPATVRAWRNRFASLIERKVSRGEAQEQLRARVDAGELVALQIEVDKEPTYFPAADLPILEALAADEIPALWRPLDATTEQEVRFLSPLDPVVPHGAKDEIFDFYYIWEIYKPATVRRWGYYTMPILYGDRLVGRLDPRLDRSSQALIVNGFWLEEGTEPEDPALLAAVGRGLRVFATFHQAEQIDLSAIQPQDLRERLQRLV